MANIFENLYDQQEGDYVKFEIDDIVYEDDAGDLIPEDEESRPTNITFKYGGVTMSVNSEGRFKEHKIIGGDTVRQKIGEEPIKVSVDSVCLESTARLLDQLRDAKRGKIFSARLPGGSLEVQFDSIATDPMAAGGAADFTSGEFIYNFSLECTEVTSGTTE